MCAGAAVQMQGSSEDTHNSILSTTTNFGAFLRPMSTISSEIFQEQPGINTCTTPRTVEDRKGREKNQSSERELPASSFIQEQVFWQSHRHSLKKKKRGSVEFAHQNPDVAEAEVDGNGGRRVECCGFRDGLRGPRSRSL